jgi:hypothetical protein
LEVCSEYCVAVKGGDEDARRRKMPVYSGKMHEGRMRDVASGSGDRENEGWREEVVYDPRTLRTEKWRERQIGPGSSFLVQRTASSQYANQCSGILVHLFCSAEQGLGY